MRKILFILSFLLPVIGFGQYYHSPYYTEVLTDTLYLKKGGVTDKIWKMKLSGDTLYYNSSYFYLAGGTSYWSRNASPSRYLLTPTNSKDSVGIGVTYPTMKLDVNGGIKSSVASSLPAIYGTSTSGYGLKGESIHGNAIYGKAYSGYAGEFIGKLKTDSLYLTSKVVGTSDSVLIRENNAVKYKDGLSFGLIKTAHFVYDTTDVKNDSSLILLSDTGSYTYFKILSVDCKIKVIKPGSSYSGLYSPNKTFDIMYIEPNAPISEVIGYIDSTSLQNTTDSLFVSWTPINAYKVYGGSSVLCGVGCSLSGAPDPGSARVQFDLYIMYAILNENMTITPTQPMCPVK